MVSADCRLLVQRRSPASPTSSVTSSFSFQSIEDRDALKDGPADVTASTDACEDLHPLDTSHSLDLDDQRSPSIAESNTVKEELFGSVTTDRTGLSTGTGERGACSAATSESADTSASPSRIGVQCGGVATNVQLGPSTAQASQCEDVCNAELFQVANSFTKHKLETPSVSPVASPKTRTTSRSPPSFLEDLCIGMDGGPVGPLTAQPQFVSRLQQPGFSRASGLLPSRCSQTRTSDPWKSSDVGKSSRNDPVRHPSDMSRLLWPGFAVKRARATKASSEEREGRTVVTPSGVVSCPSVPSCSSVLRQRTAAPPPTQTGKAQTRNSTPNGKGQHELVRGAQPRPGAFHLRHGVAVEKTMGISPDTGSHVWRHGSQGKGQTYDKTYEMATFELFVPTPPAGVKHDNLADKWRWTVDNHLQSMIALLDPRLGSSRGAQDSAADNGLAEVIIAVAMELLHRDTCSDSMRKCLLIIANAAHGHTRGSETLVAAGAVHFLHAVLAGTLEDITIQRCCLLAFAGLMKGATLACVRAAWHTGILGLIRASMAWHSGEASLQQLGDAVLQHMSNFDLLELSCEDASPAASSLGYSPSNSSVKEAARAGIAGSQCFFIGSDSDSE